MVPRKISAGLGLYVLAAGLISLAGWVFDAPRLTDWAGTEISIQPNTAVAAMALGGALLLLAAGQRWWASVAALLGGAIGAATLYQYLAGADLGIDALLLFDRPWGRRNTLSVGRMGAPGAAAWVLLGVGVLLTWGGARLRRAAVGISVGITLLSALSFVGYLFDVQQFYAAPQLTAVSMQTATMLLAASLGLMFAVPEHGLAAATSRDDAGSVLLRRMVVPVFLLPLLFGWLRMEGERAGLFDAAFGNAAFVIFTTTVLLTLLAVTARHIGRSAVALAEAAHRQRILARIGELGAKVRDTGNLLEAISQTVAQSLEVSRCGFARVDLDRGQIVVERDHHGELPSLAGAIPLAAFGSHVVEDGRAGRPTIVRDVQRIRGIDEGLLERCEERDVRSIMSVPLHRDGRWVANFWIAHHEPRHWALHEIDLMKNVAERAWLVMEKARAVEEQRAALRALAEREVKLREADRLKNEFLATLAHELRNPLAPVVTALELIKRAKGDLDLIERCRVMMDRQLGHTVRLVDDLLDVSRLSRDSIELRIEHVDVASIFDTALEAVRSLTEETGHEIQIVLPDEPVFVDGDPVRLAQVVTNLLTNACKYTEAGGEIVLEAERRGADPCISVTDSGVGIEPEMIPQAFEMFSQLGRPVAPVPGGLGIGLSLVKSLVEKHGGTVTAHSAGSGCGTQVVVRLPAAEEVAPAEEIQESDASPAGSPLAGGRVLVVDDNRDAATTLAAVLSISGYETEVTHDGQSAVERAADYAPSAVLLDIGLPDMSGYDVCRAIRVQPHGKDVVIVAVTGWGTAEDRTRSAEAGFDAHLVKPVSPSMVLETLAGLLESHNAAPTYSA